MFNKLELKEVHEQITDLVLSDGLDLTRDNADEAFEYTCNNGELCVERNITEEDKQQYLNKYY